MEKPREKPQEMQQLDKPDKVKSTNRVQEEIIRSSGREADSDDKTTPALKSLQALDLRPAQRVARSSSLKAVNRNSRTDPQNEKDVHQLQKDYENACSELKQSYRENRDQSLELRELKKANTLSHERNAHLRDENVQLREAIRARGEKITRGEKAKYIEHFELMEGHISHLQYERQKLERHMDFLTEQTREANAEKSSVENECRKLQRQVRELSNQLTECKDDLLRLQPTNQIPDNEVSDQYSNLDQQITGWVDDRTEDSQILEEHFEKVSLDDLPDLFREYLSDDQLRMAKTYPGSQPMILRYLIYRFLDTFVFDDALYLFGLDGQNVTLLKGLEEGMKLLEPRRDVATLRHWRSETLHGLLKMETFISEQERQAQLVSQTLQSTLSSLITTQPEDESGWEELHKQIILPAIQFSNTLRLSTATYRLMPHIFGEPASPNNQNPAFVYQSKDSQMIDITTHKIIKPDSVLKVAEDGRIGEEMLVVSPALLRAQKDGGQVLVSKPTRLVKLDEPMGKRPRAVAKALGAWAPSWFGGEGVASGVLG